MAKEERYVAVDPGKYNTKFNSFNYKDGEKLMKFRTKISPGTFDEDMLERGTFIVQLDEGPTYKVGYGAQGMETQTVTSKKAEVHKVCAAAATALSCGCGDHQDVNIALGVPYSICCNTEERHEYIRYMLGEPGEKHTVRIKTNSNGPVYTSSFTFKKPLVFPEGIGIVYLRVLEGPTGIIDLGDVNGNFLYCEGGEPVQSASFTNEMGGRVLIARLSQVLTAELGTRVDERIVAATLLKPYEQRHLVSTNGNKSIDIKSKEIINRYMLDYARSIRSACDARSWSLDFMQFVFGGGTSILLRHELIEVFGSRIIIPENPEFSNVMGSLRKMCYDKDIDIDAEIKKIRDAKEAADAKRRSA